MPGVETIWAVVTMVSSTGWRTDKAAAMFALKHLFGGCIVARLTTLMRAIVVLFIVIEMPVVLVMGLFVQTQKLLA